MGTGNTSVAGLPPSRLGQLDPERLKEPFGWVIDQWPGNVGFVKRRQTAC